MKKIITILALAVMAATLIGFSAASVAAQVINNHHGHFRNSHGGKRRHHRV